MVKSANMKKCNKCGLEKELTEFTKDSKSKDCQNLYGLDSRCIGCKHEYYLSNKKHIDEQHRQYYSNNKIVINKHRRKYYRDNKEEALGRCKRYREKNSEKIAKTHRAYAEKHKDEIKEYRKNKRKTDLNYRLACNLRTRTNEAIKQGSKAGSAVSDLGCSINFLKGFLEAQFQEGMTWKNWGNGKNKWNIDHIIPLSSFDLTDREQFLQASHFSNLRPLWMKDNLKKHKSIL